VLVLGAIGLVIAIEAGSSPARTETVPAIITIDSQIGITFGPAPETAAPKLTALQAFKRYERVGEITQLPSIPANVTVKLGLLTVPVGPADAPGASTLTKKNGIAYTVLNHLAYGYSWHRCPASGNPFVHTLPANPCIDWNFVDANTGKQIIETYQMQPGAAEPSHVDAPNS
jgi:hypothetical protein